jgi:prophage tail gpP-like protein
MSDVVLSVNKQKYDGWTSVRITRGIEQMSGAFEMGFTDRWHGQNKPWPIKMGDACSVAIDGSVVITGYVDDVTPDFDAQERRMACTGRDAAGDLVDCSAASKTWTNQTLTKIAVDICKPFKVGVKAVVAVGKPFGTFSIQEGETAFDAIDRMCRHRGVLPVSDGKGGLLITGPGSTRVKTVLMDGVNLLSGSVTRSMKDRYQIYKVKGQDTGFDDSTPEQNAGPTGTATDKNVKRARTLVILSEVPANAAALKDRAIWEAAVRRGRSIRARVAVQGWSHADGLWQPNTLVKISSAWLGIDEWMLITTVTYTRDDQGTRTDMELCLKEGFMPEEIPEKEEKV